MGTNRARTSPIDGEMARRARRFRDRVAAKGMTLAEFARRAGLTRNVLWGLSQGRAPKPEIKKKMDALLGPDT